MAYGGSTSSSSSASAGARVMRTVVAGLGLLSTAHAQNPYTTGKAHDAANEGPAHRSLAVAPELSWPCKGINPYICGDCPSGELAAHMMNDLSISCNIPDYLGLETKADFDPTLASEVTDTLIYHSKKTQTSMLNPVMMEHVCISPVCRWRLGMAFNAFGHCATMEQPNVDSVNWRNYRDDVFDSDGLSTELSMHTVKHFIAVMQKAKNDCRTVRHTENVHTGLMLHQKYQLTGVDIRTDTTMRNAELAFRQAFAELLGTPMRSLNVRLE